MAPPINIGRYVAAIKENLNLTVADEIIEKDLLLTLMLAEFQKKGLGKELIFKGGTLLSRNYLEYHRFSEDLDFIHRNSRQWQGLSRKKREREIKQFIDIFVPRLREVADSLGLEFSTDRSDTRFCTILHGRALYIFRVYYSQNQFIKIEINFVERMLHPPVEVSVKAITDFFNSQELLFTLGLRIENFRVLSYPLEEIILEKYRAILTRTELKERDLFDLFLISGSLEADTSRIVEKMESSALINKELEKMITDKHSLLERQGFLSGREKIEELAIRPYDHEGYEAFKENIWLKMREVCRQFLGR